MGVSIRAAKDPSANITSFFKVMIGEDFSEVLFLPPIFARTLSNLINQKFELEDANGLKWTVLLSKYKGALAFQKGWNAFSVEHGLKIGDFLVFKILKHAHFLVTVFGKNGCEKISLPEFKGNKKKRKRTNERSNDRNKYFPGNDSDNVNGQYSNTSAVSVPNMEVNHSTSNTDDGNNLKVVSKMTHTEEPFYMINRDIRSGQSEIRDSLYDLESIEMCPSDVPGSGKTVENERSQDQNVSIPNLESEVSKVGQSPVSKEVQSCLTIPEVPKFDIMQKFRDMGQIDNKAPFAKNDSKSKIASGQEQCSKTGSGKEQFAVYRRQHTPIKTSGQKSEKKFAAGLDFSDLAISIKNGIYSSGTSVKKVKQEPVEIKEEACVRRGIPGKSFSAVKQEQVERKEEGCVYGGIPGYQWTTKLDQSSYPTVEVNNHVPNAVKAEPVDTIDLNCNIVAKIPFSETPDKHPYLELPDRLLPLSSRTKQRLVKTLVIYLRGPITGVSMWPVLYIEKSGLKLLTSGWDAFRTANGFSTGDECVFQREDQYELIFRVTLLPK